MDENNDSQKPIAQFDDNKRYAVAFLTILSYSIPAAVFAGVGTNSPLLAYLALLGAGALILAVMRSVNYSPKSMQYIAWGGGVFSLSAGAVAPSGMVFYILLVIGITYVMRLSSDIEDEIDDEDEDEYEKRSYDSLHDHWRYINIIKPYSDHRY